MQHRRRINKTAAHGATANTDSLKVNSSTPHSWFLAEMEKAFERIQHLLDLKLNTVAESVEELINQKWALAQRVIELKEKHADYEESLNTFHLDLAEFTEEI